MTRDQPVPGYFRSERGGVSGSGDKTLGTRLKLALCFKHLIPQFPCIFDVDAFLFNLWKHFKYRPLAMSFLGNSADTVSTVMIM